MSKNLTTEETNKLFYDKVYKSNNTFIGYLKLLLSFDQQSKSRINFSFLKRHFNGKVNDFKILDYGAGRGSLIAKFNESNNLYACDISSESVLHLRKVGSLIKKPITSFKPDEISSFIEDESLDIITSSHVLEHVPNDEEIMSLFYQKLKISGILLLNLPVNEVWKDPNHVREYTEESVVSLLELFHFKVIDTDKAGKVNGWMIKKKISGRSSAVGKIIKMSFFFFPLNFFRLLERNLFKKQANTHFLVLAQKMKL